MNKIKKKNPIGLIFQMIIVLFVMPLLPLLLTFQWNWWEAWIYGVISLLGFIISRLLAAKKHPDIIKERVSSFSNKGVKPWDKFFSPAMGIGGLLIPLVAGLDANFNWSDNFTLWEFQDDASESDRGSISNISFYFWDDYDDFKVDWKYDAATNTYRRSTGGEPHKDLETDQQIAAKNVVVLFTKETGPVDDLKHILYATTGKGEALIFQNGQVIEANWSKATRTSRTKFTDQKGKEIEFVRGQTWVQVLATGSEVTY